MRNKFLKGLSVAFAAAMAFTVVAPALTTEAASSKAYVVTEKKYGVNTGEDHANGDVTKYTYDSRGRVIKEVTTSTAGSDSANIQIANNATQTVKVTTVSEGPTATGIRASRTSESAGDWHYRHQWQDNHQRADSRGFEEKVSCGLYARKSE